MPSPRRWLSLLGFAGAVTGAAWFGSRYSPARPVTRDWYAGLRKPCFNPPNAVFPVVWTPLYALIALSGWRVWESGRSAERTRSLILWAMQLTLNAEWTLLFFGRRNPAAALVDVVLLEAVNLDYLRCVRKVDGSAAACFVPYIGWAAFATALNAAIMRMNVPNPKAGAEG